MFNTYSPTQKDFEKITDSNGTISILETAEI